MADDGEYKCIPCGAEHDKYGQLIIPEVGYKRVKPGGGHYGKRS